MDSSTLLDLSNFENSTSRSRILVPLTVYRKESSVRSYVTVMNTNRSYMGGQIVSLHLISNHIERPRSRSLIFQEAVYGESNRTVRFNPE